MKVALVCDWLTNVGGAEKVLLEFHRLYPEAPIYTSKYSKRGIDWFADADVRTGWLQIFPARVRRLLGPLRMRWFRKLDLSEYDLVISVTGAEAKAVGALKPGARHICYCHAPTQYYWQMYDEYVANPGFGFLNPLVRVFFKALVKGQRRKDLEAAKGPDVMVTISEYTKGLIRKYYKRDAIVVHPPVDIDAFRSGRKDGSYYITTSRQVTWKRLDLAVRACVKLKRKLMVVGEGPEHGRLVELAKGIVDDNGEPLVTFVPLVDKVKLAELLAGARGYIFPSLEPFGIAPVEALAAGCPVIAYGEGGALDYIHNGVNGVLFEKQTVGSLCEGIIEFEKKKFDTVKVVASVREFATERFDKEIKELVKRSLDSQKEVNEDAK